MGNNFHPTAPPPPKKSVLLPQTLPLGHAVSPHLTSAKI